MAGQNEKVKIICHFCGNYESWWEKWILFFGDERSEDVVVARDYDLMKYSEWVYDVRNGNRTFKVSAMVFVCWYILGWNYDWR